MLSVKCGKKKGKGQIRALLRDRLLSELSKVWPLLDFFRKIALSPGADLLASIASKAGMLLTNYDKT